MGMCQIRRRRSSLMSLVSDVSVCSELGFLRDVTYLRW